jgi:mono/diheme cytochrome c family protein
MPAGPEHRRRLLRLAAPPLVLFMGISGLVYGLARAQPFAPSAPPIPAGAPAGAGDIYRGGIAFTQTCSGCHGTAGAGGSAPALKGNPLSPEEARAVIVTGRGIMPAGLASGQTLDDIVAYLGTILAPPGGTP